MALTYVHRPRDFVAAVIGVRQPWNWLYVQAATLCLLFDAVAFYPAHYDYIAGPVA
jgi:hypothetical protein